MSVEKKQTLMLTLEKTVYLETSFRISSLSIIRGIERDQWHKLG